MKLEEIKKLNRFEFAERYPFARIRVWNRDIMDYELGVYDEDIEGIIKKGDPMLYFFTDNWYGWNDLLLCWAEKVKPIYDTMPKEVQENFYISGLKEKYGRLDIFLPMTTGPYAKIQEYTYMLEHLSTYTCSRCGKITPVRKNNLVIYSARGDWITYHCRECAKQSTYQNIKEYKIKDEYIKKCGKKNPLNEVFKEDWSRKVGDWYVRITTYENGVKNNKIYDCRELLEGM